MKLSQAIDGYLLFKATRASDTTIVTDTGLLNQFKDWIDGDPDVETIDANVIRRYLEHEKARGLQPCSRLRIHAVLSGLYTWLSSDEINLVKTNPVRAISPPRPIEKVIETLTQEQIEALISVTSRARWPRRAKALVLFLLDSEARATETAELRLDNVNLKSGKVKVLGKRGKERFVYLGKRTRSALWLYIHEERPGPARLTDGNLFLTFDGYPMNRHSIRRALYRLGKWSGVKVNPHLFRHTAAIERLRAGMNAFSLQKFLGHSTLEMTKKYLTALANEDVEVQAQRTSPADNWRL